MIGQIDPELEQQFHARQSAVGLALVELVKAMLIRYPDEVDTITIVESQSPSGARSWHVERRGP